MATDIFAGASHSIMIGLLQLEPKLAVHEQAASAGFDFVMIDAEHGALEIEDIERSVAAAHLHGLGAYVRLAEQDVGLLIHVAKAGANAVIVPHVATAAQADLMAQSLPELSDAGLIVIIECAEGVQNSRAILATQGVQAVLVGPSDLSADLGRPGDFANQAYSVALSAIETAARETARPIGTAPHGEHSAEALINRGHTILILGSDRTLTSAQMAGAAKAVRRLASAAR